MSSKKVDLSGKVCLVTGASRGIGKGIALQLAKAGAIVYITGRTLDKKSSKDVGSLRDTAKEVEAQAGRCIPVQCDHSKDSDIKNLFDRIEKEQNGQLDVLVNNAYSAVNVLAENRGKAFWEQPIGVWDDVNNVGLRNHYICTVYAAKMMVPRKKGLIVNISSGGGLRYVFNVAYGIGKEACDRMAVDCGIELREHNVCCVSLWPGAVKTELVDKMLTEAKEHKEQDVVFKKMESMFTRGPESTQFAGLAISHLAADKNMMNKTAKVLITTDLANEYGFTDIDGGMPANFRSLSYLLSHQGYWIADYIPSFIKVPYWILALGGNKF
ncbi:hypothetical protein HELRODRAFT_83027 [Helobdella robusta]|uniref:Dehydrogenase/reductase SDR family member 1 n=1 Tax=Helobdella robusta TaxID=6412 RepID=T1G4Z3_HELRO|nr:hypothetical protein HELRODRAFT_83027 [Helobdella robusta]ESO00622.1 hypothetical protein HELRODRAFT_83027 [Helobdella robusta]